MYRVFVVEDSPSICEVIIGSLESSGLVQVVGHADAAGGALADSRLACADAVIIDLALRASSGFELLEKMRSSPQLAHLKKIVLTNYASGIFRKRALALGAEYFFDKSLQFDQVVDLLDALAQEADGYADNRPS